MLKGVISVAPGYAGGNMPDPSYEDVSGGSTGHAEVIKIEFDSQVISFSDLLAVFFGTHDPTIVNRQGNDVGEQYRSVILYSTPEQKKLAEDYIKELNESSKEGKPIVTEVVPLEKFYEAEDYHHNYYEKNKDKSYCQVVINPKLKKAKEQFVNLLKDGDV